MTEGERIEYLLRVLGLLSYSDPRREAVANEIMGILRVKEPA